MICHEHLLRILHYNPSTGTWTLRVDRGRAKAGSIAGCLDSRGYWRVCADGRPYQSHVLAWFYMTGKWPPSRIDHKDTIKDHNWWSNLRLATQSQNIANANLRSDNTTGLKGVTFVPSKKKPFKVMITVLGKAKYVGSFPTIEEAGAAYLKEAQNSFGEFARG